MRLSVLDQIPIVAGGDGPRAIRETFALAQLADRLGYERYWLGEHHNTTALACPAPEVISAMKPKRQTLFRGVWHGMSDVPGINKYYEAENTAV